MSNSDFDVNAILDGTLDDLADMPEFKPFPAGTHKVVINWVDKTAKDKRVNNHPGFELKMKLVETVEVTNAGEAVLAPGAETSVLYLLDNEIGQGSFKKILASLAEHYGAKSNRELVAESNGAEVLVITKQRANKEKTQVYTDVVELQVI
jgi:hypothetical protein